MKIIGVASQLCMGKDVLCDYLTPALNVRRVDKGEKKSIRSLSKCSFWKRAAFANAVKRVYETSFGVDREFIEKWKRNSDPPPGMLMNVRQGLQFIGDGFRKIKDEIWIEIALREEMIVLSDSRYINEAKAVRDNGGMMIVMYRPGFLNDDPNLSESQIKPIIEFCVKYLKEGDIWSQINAMEVKPNIPNGLNFYDYFFINDGTLEDLYKKVDDELVPYVENRERLVQQ